MASRSTDAPLPPGAPAVFRATVHGVAFADRARALAGVRSGDAVHLVPDPPLGRAPGQVWVHGPEGDPLGHLPDVIGLWLAPWMRAGGRARARALRVGGPSVPSWKRLLLEVRCGGEEVGAARR